MFDGPNETGIIVHWYGPHIFHTNHQPVYDYLQNFSEWDSYEHKVLGKVDGQLVPIPFNFTSIEKLFPTAKANFLITILKESFPSVKKVSILDLLNHQNKEIVKFGQFVYNKVFVNYTAKQWGLHPDYVDQSVINRIPVVLGYDDRYFNDQIQYMPKNGFTVLFEKMLNHHNITMELNCDAEKRLSFDQKKNRVFLDRQAIDCPVVYTGSIDCLLKFEFGELPYRSLDMVFENYQQSSFQPIGVVNYPNEEDFTRITEFKYLTNQFLDGKTTIMKEYPLPYNKDNIKGNVPYYPIINPANLGLYQKYQNELAKFSNVYLCGRLAEYKYYNMDAVVDRAFEITNEIKRNNQWN